MKKVSFNEKKNRVKIMVTWKLAHEQARKKYWEFFAFDRLRFRNRIDNISVVLSPILNCNYRKKMYFERFQ